MLIALFLLTLKKGSQRQNRLLALLIFSLGILIISRAIGYSPGSEKYFRLLSIGFDFRFFIGPLLYLYLRSIFKPSRKMKLVDLLHSCVFIFVVISQYANNGYWINPWKVFVLIDIVQITIYLLWSFSEFKLTKLFIRSIDFKLEQRLILWLQFFIISNIITLLFLILSWLFINKVIIVPYWDYWITRLVGFTNFVFINSIVYIALKIPDLFISIKYKNSNLPEAIKERYKTKLIGYMETNKPYINPSLSLNSLADEISISSKHLSQIINNTFQQNFYHFINSYRIEECKRKLSDQTQIKDSVLEIAYEAGFNSKNTFNSAFKNNTGLTPSEFRKQKLSKTS